MRIAIVAAALVAFGAWMWFAPPGIDGKLVAIGYAVCHRIDSHSLHIGDQQLPMCARCTGEFFAAFITLVFQFLFSPRAIRFPRRGLLVVLGIFALAFAVDGLNSYLALLKGMAGRGLQGIANPYETTSVTRVITGSGMGILLGTVIFPLVNAVAWKNGVDQPALTTRKLAALVAILAIANAAILSGNEAFLSVAGTASVLGALAMLVLVFTVVWLMATRTENSVQRTRHLFFPLVAGLTIALLLVLSVDSVRFGLTHSWAGPPL